MKPSKQTPKPIDFVWQCYLASARARKGLIQSNWRTMEEEEKSEKSEEHGFRDNEIQDSV